MRNLPYTEKSDVYSFGIMMWEVLTRENLYPGLHPLSVGYKVGETFSRVGGECTCGMRRLCRRLMRVARHRITSGSPVLQVMVEDLRPEIPEECPDHLAVLMRQCWHVDEPVRPNFKDLLNTVRRRRTRLRSQGAGATLRRKRLMVDPRRALPRLVAVPKFEGLASPYLSQFINNLKEFQEMNRKAKHQQEVRSDARALDAS